MTERETVELSIKTFSPIENSQPYCGLFLQQSILLKLIRRFKQRHWAVG
ncbi:hypothetical protein MtrunA17_Chr1g0211581 [Medicago truncatula]|uniref:Uncharacterized protein n=1 Tax=Medicago truncatula TaxID=3880 RepID=A0A396K1F4_MEDTR|nr:hypothetical protein MtrunA17_Chr1g0211581 [Medicago truncatula]